MEKILCSREPWDSIIGHNRPNGTSRTWNFAENKKQPSLLSTLTPEIVDSYIKDSSLFNVHHYSLSFHEDFEDVEIIDIGDKKHIYIIRVYNPDYFYENINTGFSCISPLVLEDIKIGKCALIIECTTEGKYTKQPNTELDIIERWRVKAKLPEYSVSVIHGNLICDEYVKRNDLKINAYGVSAFESFFDIPEDYAKDLNKIVNFNSESSNPKKYFLSYNRQPRAHRLLFGLNLYKRNILNKGLLSLTFPNNMRLSSEYNSKVVDEKEYERFRLGGNHTIDISTEHNLATNFTLSNYEDTFISVVSETIMDTGCIFFSEKIWKPIAIGHPFILMSSPNSLEKLKDMGYMTFSELWDESYDKVISEHKRVEAIAELVNKFTKMSNKELADLRIKAEPILKHNRLNFNRILKEEYVGRPELRGTTLPITNIVKDIYNTLGYKPSK